MSELTYHRDVEQGSAEWLALRAGKMTSSIANKLMTKTGNPSKAWRGEIGRVIAERMGWQEPAYVPDTEWIERGKAMEPEARAWLSFILGGREIEQVGFIEDGLFGYSPDGIVTLTHDDFPLMIDPGDEWRVPVEIKVPKPSTHISWSIPEQGADFDPDMPADYIPQCVFGSQLMGTEAVLFMSYCEHTKPLVVLEDFKGSRYLKVMEAAKAEYAAELSKQFKRFTGEDL